MGRLLLTNVEQWNLELRNCYEKYGCQESGYIQEDFFLTTYRKTNFKTYNLVQRGKNFIASTGTLIYKDKVGKEALEELFFDMDITDIKDIRKELMGSYVVVYKKDDLMKVFVDETNTYAFYYSIDADKFILTNTFYHIARCLKQQISKCEMIEYALESCVLDEKTPFNNINRIQAEDCIVLDLKNKKYAVEKVELNEYKLVNTEPQKIIDELCAVIRKYAKRQRNLTDNPVLFTTGGVDSRLMLATYLDAGFEPSIASWKGSPIIMNTKIQDTEITKKIAETMDLNYQEYDVSQNFLEDYKKLDKKEFDDVGEYAVLYAHNKKWMHMIRNNVNIEFADFGYFGEILKGWDLLDEKYKNPMKLADYTDMYIGRSRYIGQDVHMKCFKEYRESIKQKLNQIVNKEHMDSNNLSKDDCMKLYYHYRLHADTQRCGYVNQFCYSFIVYAQKEIADLINQIPYQLKQREKLNLELVYRMKPELLELPYFSHCRYFKYDAKNNILKEKTINKLKGYLVRRLKASKLGGRLALLKRSKGNAESLMVKKLCASEIRKTKSFQSLEMELDEKMLSYLPKYFRFLYVVRMSDFVLEED